LIDENQAVIAESLKIKNMMHNRKLARAIADAGWGGFLSKLKYKAERSGKFFIQTDTFFRPRRLARDADTSLTD
jgi:putative transposase